MMDNEEFLKLASECGLWPAQTKKSNLLTYSREIERRALERAKAFCEKQADRNSFDGQQAAYDCAAGIRAMIKEKE